MLNNENSYVLLWETIRCCHPAVLSNSVVSNLGLFLSSIEALVNFKMYQEVIKSLGVK